MSRRPAAEVVAELVERVKTATAPAEAVPWFMDIDGVLNVIGKPPTGGWGHYERTAVMTSSGYAFTVCWAPVLVRILNELSERGFISVRWLTTWEHDAHTHFAPALGLKLGQWVAGEDQGFERSWWKLRVIREHIAETQEDPGLFIWSDDEITDDLQARQETDFLPPERALIIACDPVRGLTPTHLHAVLDAIEASTQGSS